MPMREIGPVRALANLLLAAALAGLAAGGVALIARRHWQVQPTFVVRGEFPKVGGLAVGDKVRVQGVDAGVVAAIEPPKVPGGSVVVVLRVDDRLRSLVRSDAVATIASEGVVGGKIVEIVPGEPDAAPLPVGGTLRTEAPTELADLLADARSALARVESVAEAAEVGIGEVNAIAATIRSGRGTIGRLIADDEAYQKLVAVTDRGERALVALDENLDAMKGLWPLSGYFRERGYDDAERVLYRPDARRDGRTIPADRLFEPGSAVLKRGGREELDEFARWFKARSWPNRTEVVVAAFTQAGRSIEPAQARILAEGRARAVRAYLDDRHGLFALSWFRTRKSAAAGFVGDGESERIEIALFTTQAG